MPLLESATQVIATVHAAVPLAATGQGIAENLKTFIAPIAGILIGLVGLKYLFGENRSLAGFVGFVFLGACVYALIQYGQLILTTLGGILKGIIG